MRPRPRSANVNASCTLQAISRSSTTSVWANRALMGAARAAVDNDVLMSEPGGQELHRNRKADDDESTRENEENQRAEHFDWCFHRQLFGAQETL